MISYNKNNHKRQKLLPWVRELYLIQLNYDTIERVWTEMD